MSSAEQIERDFRLMIEETNRQNLRLGLPFLYEDIDLTHASATNFTTITDQTVHAAWTFETDTAHHFAGWLHHDLLM